jgi:hypothetical protein
MKQYVTIATLCTVMTATAVFVNLGFAGEKSDGVSSTTTEETTRSQLDSRNVPRPEWTQVTGEVKQSRTLSDGRGADRLILTLKAIEGGVIQADLGDAEQLKMVELQDDDYVHVRGRMVTQGDDQVLVAGELIADGKVVRINRDDWEVREELWQASKEGLKGMAVPTSPAAPQPKR